MARSAWLLLVLACRFTNRADDLDRRVDVPVTLDEARARAKPPEVVVDIETETVHHDPGEAPGNGSCHAGAMCVFALIIKSLPSRQDKPYDEVFQHVTIRTRGAITHEVAFRDGAFAGASIHESDRFRVVGKVFAVGRWRLVETSGAPVGPDGAIGTVTRSPLLLQVDLTSAYLNQLVADQKHHKHEAGSLGESLARNEMKAQVTIIEMKRVLAHDEAARLAHAWQSEPRLNERVKELLRTSLLGTR